MKLIAILAALGISAGVAKAVEPATKDIFSYPLKYWAAMLGFAVLGGLVAWYAKVKRGELVWTSIHHLVGELTTAAFAGLCTFLLCEAMSVPPLFTGPIVGLAGHAGSRAITAAETWAHNKWGIQLYERRSDKPPPQTGPGAL